jgi:hypothetical protein
MNMILTSNVSWNRPHITKRVVEYSLVLKHCIKDLGHRLKVDFQLIGGL